MGISIKNTYVYVYLADNSPKSASAMAQITQRWH